MLLGVLAIIKRGNLKGAGDMPNVELPEWYTDYKSGKMVAVESDVESGDAEYNCPPIEGENNEEFAEEEIFDDIHDSSTARLFRQLGEGSDDTAPLRSELQHTIDTERVDSSPIKVLPRSGSVLKFFRRLIFGYRGVWIFGFS